MIVPAFSNTAWRMSRSTPPICTSHWKRLPQDDIPQEKLAKLVSELQRLKAIEKVMLASPDQQIWLADPKPLSMATSTADYSRVRVIAVEGVTSRAHVSCQNSTRGHRLVQIPAMC